jgi:hypothetical protein
MIVKKKFFLIAIVAAILAISLGIYYFVNIYPKTQSVPDDKGFIPLCTYFENDIQNVTLTPDSSVSINVTFTSNLDKEITVTITPTLAALNNPSWFNATLQPNPVMLNAYGTNATTLTIHLTADTPPSIQPDALVLGLESTQYPSIRLWNSSLPLYVKSP